MQKFKIKSLEEVKILQDKTLNEIKRDFKAQTIITAILVILALIICFKARDTAVKYEALKKEKEEYREFKKYYHTRFKKIFGLNYKDKTAEIIFRNGYSKMSPKIKCRCKLRVGQGKEEWGAEKGKEYYVLEILKIVGGEDDA